MRSRCIGLGFGMLLLFLALAPTASADSYTYTTTGCFGSCPNSSVSFNDSFVFNQVDATLSFTGSAATTSGGSVSLGSFAFSLLNRGISTYSGLFSLDVLFTAPAGTSGNPFMALVTGNVFYSAGGVTITLNPPSQQFTDANGTFGLDLTTNPIQISSANPNATVYGTIASVSEGSGWATLVLSGIVMLGAIGMRNRFAF